MEKHGVDREGNEWIGFYEGIVRGKRLIVHAYEVAGQQWNHRYQIFLYEKNGLRLLHESETVEYKREKALEAGRLYAETHDFGFRDAESELVLVTNKA